MSKIIFSGIQPTGILHIGNYLGAIKQWVGLQKEVDQSIFCIVDLHAITVYQDPKELRDNIYKMAAIYMAAGIDLDKSVIFVQSSRPEHTQLQWVLNCNTKIGELSRMTQFKDKSQKQAADNTGVGLFDYPVLMAADILLYGASLVPVGEDQKQHVEITRDIAERFNSRYGKTFEIPEPIINKTSARIMGLDDPLKKMSKSATSPLNYIAIDDDSETISNKIKRAVTDSGSEVKYSSDKPAISNLLNIFSEVSGENIEDLEKKYSGQGYGIFKNDLSEALVEFLSPIQKKYSQYLADRSEIERILKNGSNKIAPIAARKIEEVYNKVGLGIN